MERNINTGHKHLFFFNWENIPNGFCTLMFLINLNYLAHTRKINWVLERQMLLIAHHFETYGLAAEMYVPGNLLVSLEPRCGYQRDNSIL